MKDKLEDRLWETYIHRFYQHFYQKRLSPSQSDQLLTTLRTWTPESPCSAQFLGAFIRPAHPDRWMQWEPDVRHSILLELMRIDDGRGHISGNG